MPRGRPTRRKQEKQQKTVLCKLHLLLPIHKRLQMAAIARGETISEAAAEVFDRHLPRYDVKGK
jgi:hypothetical protein